MIQFCKGNIFDSNCQTIVVPVNTVGVMGAGLALEFKNRYAGLYKFYREKCFKDELKVGKLIIYKCKRKPHVLLFPTKAHWKNKSLISYIDLGMEFFVKNYKNFGIESASFPALGCGLGELSWDLVKQKIELWLYSVDILVEIYEPLQKKSAASF